MNKSKVKLFVGVLLFALLLSVFADDKQTKESIIEDEKYLGLVNAEWTPVQIGCIYSLFQYPVDVYGLNLNAFATELHNTYGLIISPIIFIDKKGKYVGLNFSLFSISGSNGKTLSENYGLSIALAHLNFYGSKLHGLSIGAFNFQEHSDVQFGVINSYGCNKLTFGLFNYDCRGLQFGLINYHKDAMIPYIPLVYYRPIEK